MKQNRVLAKLKNGETTTGISLGLGSVVTAELLASAGFDWIWIDAQHGEFDDAALLGALQVIFPTPSVPIVRPGSNEFFRIGRALDHGAEGLVVPMVNSAEHAAAAVHAAKYPPQGGRSSGGPRLGLFGEDYFDRANDEILVAVQIETAEALAAADDIAAVEGVDCLFVGPSDLRTSMQVERWGEEHEGAIADTLQAARNAGVAAGIACGNPEDALKRAEQGFQLVTCGSDGSLLRAGLEATKEALGQWCQSG